MKLWNALMTGVLWISLSLAPQVLKAQNGISSLVESEIKDAEILNLSQTIHLNWKVSEIKDWEIVYILYPTKSKKWEEVGILVLGIPYDKKNMTNFKSVLYPANSWKFVKMLIADNNTEIPWTDFFTVYKLEK